MPTPESSFTPYNFEYNHTVGQPLCQFSKQQLFNNSNFSKYLKDTLFPMAHSVFEAPVAAYCSTWAIEAALWRILYYAIGEDHDTLRLPGAPFKRTRSLC
jgi:hypothetical protein